MSAHPLSLRTRILLDFPSAANVRFEWNGWRTVFYVSTGGDQVLQEAVRRFLIEHGPMATPIELANSWVDGPRWPAIYDQFTDRQRELMESCDLTESGLEAAMLQLCGWLAEVRSDTVGGGHIQLTVVPRGGTQPSADLLKECHDLAVGALGVPGVRFDVVVGSVPPRAPLQLTGAPPHVQAMFRWTANQSSREGITDPAIRKLFDEDEDYYRDAREHGFVARRRPIVEDKQNESGIFLPFAPEEVDARNLLLVFDRIYFPASAYTKETERSVVYGVPRDQIPRLVRDGRFVPVLTERLGEYDQRELRSLLDAGRCVTPRRLSSWIASQILDSNPLWRTPKSEILLVREVLSSVRREVSDGASKLSPQLAKLTSAWLDFETDGCAHFMMAVTNQSTRVPLWYGPGAFAGKVLGEFLGAQAPDLEAQMLGLDVSYAAALGVACFPQPREQLYPIYDFIGSLAGNRPVDTLEHLPVMYTLDTLIEELELACPEGMALDAWLEFVDEQSRRDLRAALATALGDSCASVAAAQDAAKELGVRVTKIAHSNERQARLVEKYEFVGVIADGLILSGAVPDLPFGSSVVGFLLKHGASWLWEKLETSPATREVKVALEAANHLVSPSLIRILHMRRKLRKKASK